MVDTRAPQAVFLFTISFLPTPQHDRAPAQPPLTGGKPANSAPGGTGESSVT